MRDEAAHLEKILRPLLPLADGAASRFVVHPVRRGHLSRVFRGDHAANDQSVVIKVCLDPATGAPDSSNAASYYAALGDVLALSRLDRRIGCSTPILLLKEPAIVVASWIDGSTVEHIVQRGTRAEARRAIMLSGEWLSRFHRAAGLTRQVWDMQSAVARLGDLVATARRGGIATPQLLRAADLLQRTAAQVGAIEIPWSRQHGDFKPSNLIVHGDTVAAIDIDFRASAPCVVDAAQFLNHVALQRPWRLPRDGWVGFVEAAFHVGNAQGGVAQPAMPLAWARLHHALRLATQYRQWSKPPKSWITGWCVHSLVRRLSAQLAGMEASR